LETSESPISFEDLDEFPALPDFTIPFLGGIYCGLTGQPAWEKQKQLIENVSFGHVLFSLSQLG
jgi:hypothetical protein